MGCAIHVQEHRLFRSYILDFLTYYTTGSGPGCLASVGRSCLVGRGRHIASPAGPIDVIVLALGILLAGVLGLDLEGVRAKVIALRLQQIRREFLRAVPVVEAEGGAKGRRGNAPSRPLADNVSPPRLRLVDGFVEEVVEQQVLEVRVLAVRRRNVLQEHRPDNAATAPHQGNRRFVQFPAVFSSSLRDCVSA